MISSLRIFDVQDRGIPNSEHVVLRADAFCDLGHFWMGIGLRQGDNSIFPINDNLLWLGSGYVVQGDWIFVYTGLGTPTVNEIPNQKNRIYTLHWNRDKILFGAREIFPYLIFSPSVNLPMEFSTKALPEGQNSSK